VASSPSSPRRYDSDLTDPQWQLVEPLLPPPAAAGRREKHPRREIVNAILYIVRTGCAWRLLPKEYPPWQTVFWYFQRWQRDGTIDRVHDALRDRLRDEAGRDPMASAGIVDAARDGLGTPLLCHMVGAACLSGTRGKITPRNKSASGRSMLGAYAALTLERLR